LLGIPATVVMPKFAPLVKVSNCQKLGATVVLHGRDFSEAKAHRHEIAKEKSLAYIDGYDDPAIIAGQGTMGLEIVEQIPDLEAVIVPVGGAGLIAGVSLAVKTLRPNAKIIAVEAENVASFSAALEAGKPTKIAIHPTLADGLAIPQVGSHAFQIAKPLVDLAVTVTEEQIALAILSGRIGKERGGRSRCHSVCCVHVWKVKRARRQASGPFNLRRQHRPKRSQSRN
jgi:threonine dehydratase